MTSDILIFVINSQIKKNICKAESSSNKEEITTLLIAIQAKEKKIG